MTTYPPAYQRLYAALRRLATDEGDVQERLREAWYHIAELRLAFNPNDVRFQLPSWLAQEIRELTAFWDTFESPQIDHAVASLTTEECATHANDIWVWYHRLREE